MEYQFVSTRVVLSAFTYHLPFSRRHRSDPLTMDLMTAQLESRYNEALQQWESKLRAATVQLTTAMEGPPWNILSPALPSPSHPIFLSV